MKHFGISVYPEHTTKEKAYAYLKLAGSLGFKRVFTCFLSVKESKEELVKSFKAFCRTAHEAGLIVSVDTNPQVFAHVGATPYDLSVFHEIGFDILRLDGHFGTEEDAAITRNPYGIRIEYNASANIAFANLIENGADKENMCFCSNFFPQRHTGMGFKRYAELTGKYAKAGFRTASFVSSHAENTFGPWPVYDGLPTLEMHRDLPIDLQARHLIALGFAQDILIGNCFASQEELEALAETDVTKITMKADFLPDLSETEKQILLWDRHVQRTDCNDDILRSSWPRVVFAGKSIPARVNTGFTAHRGDLLIVNDKLEHYRGELWVVCHDIEVSDAYNLVGHLSENEEILLDCVHNDSPFGIIQNGVLRYN